MKNFKQTPWADKKWSKQLLKPLFDKIWCKSWEIEVNLDPDEIRKKYFQMLEK